RPAPTMPSLADGVRSPRATVDFDPAEQEFLNGLFVAITVRETSDEAKVMRLNEFVASRYTDDDTVVDATPRSSLEGGSHWSGNLALAFASVTRSAGYDVRILDLTTTSEPEHMHSVVEVR